MAHDDRDRNLEKALARYLRSSSTTGAAPTAPPAPAPACPDAEILAAYHDGALSAEERNLWKQHVLACESCQLALAHLSTPLGAPFAAEVPELLVAAASAQHLRPQPAASLTRSASPAPISIARPRKTYFRWLVPAGALAAGLLTFVVIRESQNGRRAENPRAEIAENRPPQSPARDVEAPSSVPVEPKKAEANGLRADGARLKDKDLKEKKEKDGLASSSGSGVVGGIAGRSGAVAKESTSQAQLTQQAPSLSSSNAAGGPAVSLQQQQRQQQMARVAVVPQPAPPPPPARPQDQSSFIASDSVAPAPPAAQKTAPPAPAQARSSAGAASPTNETVETFASSAALTKVRGAAQQSPQTFGAPGGKFLWRVGAAGSIEQSTDAGATWNAQVSNVTVELTAGYACSTKLAWVVGRSGTILRTTDSGEHWVPLSSPVAADIGGIRATDAFHVVIWVAPDPGVANVKMYQTSDGGVTWSLAPSK